MLHCSHHLTCSAASYALIIYYAVIFSPLHYILILWFHKGSINPSISKWAVWTRPLFCLVSRGHKEISPIYSFWGKPLQEFLFISLCEFASQQSKAHGDEQPLLISIGISLRSTYKVRTQWVNISWVMKLKTISNWLHSFRNIIVHFWSPFSKSILGPSSLFPVALRWVRIMLNLDSTN